MLFYFVTDLIITIAIPVLIFAFLLDGFQALLTSWGFAFIVLLLLGIVVSIVLSIKFRRTHPIKVAFIILAILCVFPGKSISSDLKEEQAAVEKAKHDAAQIHNLSELTSDEIGMLSGVATSEVSAQYNLTNIEPVVMYVQERTSGITEDEYNVAIVMYGNDSNGLDMFVDIEFQSLARNDINELTYTIADGSTFETLDKCLSASGLTSNIVDSKVCNQTLFDTSNFKVADSGDSTTGYEPIVYTSYDDVPESVKATLETDSYNSLINDTGIVNNDYWMFWANAGGESISVPDNGVTNLSIRLSNVAAGQYQERNIIIYSYEISFNTNLDSDTHYMYVGYAYRCYDDTGTPSTPCSERSTINAYTSPTEYDAYFDMFLSQYFATGEIITDTSIEP